MRILVAGGSGVLGRSAIPELAARGHDVVAPRRDELDLFEHDAVLATLDRVEVLYHIATRIPPPERMDDPAAWIDNDRLRADASRVLVDAALEAGTRRYVVPTVAFAYSPGPADEDTPLGDVPEHLRSVLVAEEQALRFASAGRVGVVLRLGLLYGPGTSTPRDTRFGATLHVADAGAALAAALEANSGIYNVVESDGRVSNARFTTATGWKPRR